LGIFIKNPEVERKARELARLRGVTLTDAVGQALESALSSEAAKIQRRPTFDEMVEATERFRRKAGLDKRKLKITKADFDALWEIPGLEDSER
jgi:antitoxin VapB